MDTINSILFLIFCGITSIALLTILNLLLPVKVERIREKLEGQYGRTFVIGLLSLGISSALLILLGYGITAPVYGIRPNEPRSTLVIVEHLLIPGILVLLFILIALALVSGILFGLAALASSLSRQISNVRPPLHPNLIGAALIVLSGLAPYVGWFIFTPVVVCIGLGSTFQTVFQRRPAATVTK